MLLESIIGLEIHVQLKTKSKMFCSCSNESEGKAPNTLICPVCLGHPGALPVLNKEVLHYGIKLALALNLKINKESIFERKSYFYPDLPQGYQISQFEKPLSSDGYFILENENEKTRIGIERLHLENDAAKNFHNKDYSLIDFNRAGTPLAEIVTRPDIRKQEQARLFLQKLRQLCRYLGISDADMEKGQLRCDVNISLRPCGDKNLYPKTEIKNLNSFRSVERAIKYEIEEQTKLWENGTPPKIQTTKGWNDSKQITELQRTKEEANDYRYFAEPDIPKIIIKNEQIDKIKQELPELADEKIKRFIKEYDLSKVDAEILTSTIAMAKYFESIISEFKEWLELELEHKKDEHTKVWKENKEKSIKLINGWLTSELFKLMNEKNLSIENIKITPENMAQFIKIVYLGKVNSSSAQKILKEMFDSGKDPEEIIKKYDLGQINDEKQINNIVEKVIKENSTQVEQYKSGKENLMKYFVGVAMKETSGKANPEIAEKLFKEKLK
ncbi:MAG: Asp-tRNA(Asn)/Glu-tRNA(Gln) amidotransferase subunit GatB [Patescibacteria group bacterium]|nr:Asp-tRNA(Asn)/Glu-tRNA(Gln) amidotransferase subunit GatB [Patescibacteria group bacterium]MDD4304346.1 Asp-tRNA(Asn)/Glu-tRNA(Gln) amidotransferase subunit GatB [Patescibacteria group bacterium]MDD4695369.1 Asp-tRNA(Asn)/Glu-tRNA(Gln) amidotransferase subunit GatB [Patescibacteria group bacterium]